MPRTGRCDVHGGPTIHADVDVKHGERCFRPAAVVVAVVESCPDEVPAARRDRPKRVAAPAPTRAGATVREVPDGPVQLVPLARSGL
jgi:hypothetical protein